jgi:hypothetical protein
MRKLLSSCWFVFGCGFVLGGLIIGGGTLHLGWSFVRESQEETWAAEKALRKVEKQLGEAEARARTAELALKLKNRIDPNDLFGPAIRAAQTDAVEK